MKLAKQQMRNREAGFTLVELLIVVIILAVLAAIMVPQFSGSTEEAKKSALSTSLTEIRNAIELYYHQHNNVYPGVSQAIDGSAGGVAADFVKQLTLYTELSGKTSETKTAAAKYGPYIKSTVLPKNPVDESSALLFNSGGTLGNLTATGTDAGGWWFDPTSGKFLANIAAYYAY